jgi:hypothetical protein
MGIAGPFRVRTRNLMVNNMNIHLDYNLRTYNYSRSPNDYLNV